MSDFKVNVNFGSDTFVAKPNFDIREKANLKDIELTKNGTYDPEDYGADGFGEVSVDVQPILEELTITANGEYTPQEGVDGFSKVVARVVPKEKAKVGLLRINNSCINENGIWEGGEFVDFSAITSMQEFARNVSLVKNFDNVSWNFAENTGSWSYAFSNCKSLTRLDFTNAKKTKVTNLWNAFANTHILQELKGLDKLDVSGCGDFSGLLTEADCEEIDITSWDFGKASRIPNAFYSCTRLKSFIGNKTIDDVLRDGIKAFTNAKVATTINSNAIERPSLRALINGLADLTGQTPLTLTLGATLMAKLTEEDIAVATNKNWTII